MYRISDKASSILNSQDLLEKSAAKFSELNSIFQGKIPDQPFALSGICGCSGTDPYCYPEQWTIGVLENLAVQAEKVADPYVFRPLCIEYGIYGVHLIDKILGAEVFFESGQWYNRYLNTPIGKLQYPDLENNETWGLAKRAVNTFREQNVQLPLFGLPTIASALNIAVNLYGEEILVQLALESETALHDLKVINQLLCELHRWYLDNLPLKQLQPVVSWARTQPYGFGQICGCTTQLVSSSMYNEFIAPLDDELLSVYPNGGMIHLCGTHTHHIPAWREMKSLRTIQVNDRAAEDLEIYFNQLREDQIIYLNPCNGMTVKRALEITGGQRLVIVGEIE